MTWLKLVEGYMPMQMIMELSGAILLFVVINWSLNRAGMGIPKFFAGIGVLAFIWMYLTYRIYPPIPFSVRAIYITVTGCGIFMWVSGSEKEWLDFKRPIFNQVIVLCSCFKNTERYRLNSYSKSASAGGSWPSFTCDK